MGEASHKETHATSGATKATILSLPISGNPQVNYVLTASTSKRNQDSVSVTFTMQARPAAGVSNMRVAVTITVNGVYSVAMTIGTSGTAVKNKVYSKTCTLAVGGLTTSQTTINNVVVSISGSGGLGSRSNIPCSPIPITGYSLVSVPATHYLTPNAYGTTALGWHGPSIRRKVGKDASGIEGAQNFTLTYRQKMCIGNTTAAQNQVGSFRMNITDSNGKNIAGIWVYKNKAGKAGKLAFYVNGVQENITDIDLHYGNDFFGGAESSVCTTTVTKTGGTIDFAVGSYKRTFYDAALVNVLGWHVTFSFEKYGALEKLEYNGLYWVKFVKHNCNTWKDVPNKFSANDVVVADCRNAEITLNGIPSPDLGALGNNWESFVLKPGLNQIGYSYSEWVTDEYAPTFKVKYREVFL